MNNTESRIQRLEDQLERIENSNREILEIINAAKGFFKVLGYLERPAKWMTAIIIAVTAVYTAWTTFIGNK